MDSTISGIYNNIQKEVKAKFNIDLDTEDIDAVINSQIDGFKEGIIKGVPIHFERIGKFVNIHRRDIAKESSNLTTALSEIEDAFLKEDIEEYKKQQIIKFSNTKKEIIQASNRKYAGNITLNDIRKLEDTTHNRKVIFRPLKNE